MNEINKLIAREMLITMPVAKKFALEKACLRNALLTSYFGLENMTLTVYVEGWLLTLNGCRSSFSVYAKDNDGVLEFTRKPAESKLRKLYSSWDKTDNVIDIDEACYVY